MKIIINSIDISFFKGIKHLHLDLNDDLTNIYGENGTGKSTICDAILWTLFNRNSEGSAKFSIKTFDTDGKVIPNVRHSVKLSLSINGTVRDIEKVYVEEKVVRRGRITDEVKNTTEYYIDGESYTKGDYDKFIAELINEATFKAVTDPRYFPSLHWKDQRAFLEKIAGDIDYSSIISQSRFDEIVHNEQFKTAEEYIKHLSYNIKQVKEKADSIPARIEEVVIATPSLRDWDSISAEIADLTTQLEQRKHSLYGLEHNTEDATSQELRRKIEFAQKRLDMMRESARRMADEAFKIYNDNKSKLLQALNASNSKLSDLKMKSQSLNTLITRAKETLDEIQKTKADLQNENKELVARKKAFRINEDELVCPTCGRAFEGEDKEKAIETIKQNFIADYTAKKESIQKRFDKAKENEADALALIESYKAELENINLTSTENEINTLNGEIASFEMPKTADELLSANPSYKQVNDEISQLQAQLSGVAKVDNGVGIAQLNGEIATLSASIAEKQNLLAEKATYDKCKTRENELQAELETLTEQLDSLLERKDIALEYQQECDALLEETVNNKFHLVSFRLFDTLNDGTRVPFCEAWVNGVPFSDLNSAMKINAGLDILNTIADYYDCYAPVLVDNAESTNNITATKGQQIRLYVSLDKSITIK